MTGGAGSADTLAGMWSWFVQTFRTVGDTVEAGSRRDDASQRRVWVVLLTACLSLTWINYAQSGSPWTLVGDLTTPELARLARWTIVNLVGYLLLPWLAIRFVLRERWRDYGFGRHAKGGWRPYAALLAVSAPFVVWAASLPSFQATYPFYRRLDDETFWPWMVVWWVLYGFQFLGVEAFFRGFLIHGTKARFGIGAVMVMVVPYVMIHFQKPAPEALAAIVGGVVLGVLSLGTGSIRWGVALHIAIALVMDGAVLWLW